MDEPSTGLDPASRRSLWDVVKAAKENKASGSSYGSHGAQNCECGHAPTLQGQTTGELVSYGYVSDAWL